MVSLTGTGTGSIETQLLTTDSGGFIQRGETKVLTANDVWVYGSAVGAQNQNLAVGRNHSLSSTSYSNLVIGQNVRVKDGVYGSTSIGINNATLDTSDKFQLGEFLTYHGSSGDCRILDDAIVVNNDGGVSIGKTHGVRVSPLSTQLNHSLEILTDDRSAGWKFSLSPSEDVSGANDLVLQSNRNTAIVFGDSFVPAVTNFTGQHRCALVPSETPRVGSVLVSIGKYIPLEAAQPPLQVDDAVPIVCTSSSPRDKRAFGVLSSIEEPSDRNRRVQVGSISFVREKSDYVKRAVVNGCGEGGILVCGENGNIENGDFLCTSSTPGVAMRQSEEYQCNFTCAKATAAQTFDKQSSPAMIGCIYHF